MTRRHSFSRRTGTRLEGGFTLVELLVALLAGLIVASAAFAFAKSATRVFSQEARTASAQLSVLGGFQRLEADISRAAYLSTPNMQRDLDFERVCAPQFAGFAGQMKTLTGLRIQNGDSIRITGSFVAADLFPVANIALAVEDDISAGSIVTLGSANGPLTRAGVQPNDDDAMKELFKKGRILRILDMDGRLEFGLIDDAGYSNGLPWVKTSNTIPVKGKESATCGVGGYGTQSQASVISTVEYGIVDVRASSASSGNVAIYKATLLSDAGAVPGDDSRTELVRREILIGVNDTTALVDDSSIEVVAEYAVDLRFGLWVAGGPGGGLTYIAPLNQAVYSRTVPASHYNQGTVPSGPEAIRAVEIHLTVRSREINAGVAPDADGGYPFGFPMPNDGGVARTRTLVSTVTLENQRGDTW